MFAGWETQGAGVRLAHGRHRVCACADVLVEQQARNKLRARQQSVRATAACKRAARWARFQGSGDSTGPRHS
jgi:hypothetical protein